MTHLLSTKHRHSTKHPTLRTSLSNQTMIVTSFIGALIFAVLSSSSGCLFLVIPAACDSHENCPTGEGCSAGFCFNLLASGLTSCSSDTDCADAELCDLEIGFCLPSGGDTSCYDDAECGDGACVGYICLTAEEAANHREGDVEVKTLSQLNDFLTVTAVVGTVTIGSEDGVLTDDDVRTALTGDVVLTALLRADDITFLNLQNVTSIKFSTLKSLGGSFTTTALPVLKSVSFPELNSVPTLAVYDTAGEISVEASPSLELLSAPKLGDIGWLSIDPGERDVDDTSGPLVLDFSGLHDVGNIDVTSSGGLAGVSFPSLVNVRGRVYVRFPDTATSFEFPNLATVVGELNFYSADSLTGLSFPNLTTVGELELYSNELLSTIDLSALADVGGAFTISDNPALTEILLPNLSSVSGDIDVSDNDALDICPVQAAITDATTLGAKDLSGNLTDETTCSDNP